MWSGGGSNIAHFTPEAISHWPVPNYDNPHERSWMAPYSVVWCVAGTIILGMRFWLRLRRHAGGLGLDDAIILPGWIAGLGFTVVSILYTGHGGGRHVWDSLPQERTTLVLCMWLGEFSFLICGGLTKVSILLFYRRLVSGTCSVRYKWVIWTAITFTMGYTTAFCICLLVNCTPTEAYWMAFDIVYALTKDYKCLDTSIINTMAGVCAAVSDFYAAILPCILVWRLSIPPRQKLALNVIFCMGSVVVAASAVRTYWLIKTGNSKDITRGAFNLFVWAQFELQAGIICASAPSLRIFFCRYLSGRGDSRIGETATGDLADSVDGVIHTRNSITVVRDTSLTIKTGNVLEFGKDSIEQQLWSSMQSEERLAQYSQSEDEVYSMSDLDNGTGSSINRSKWSGKSWAGM